VPEKSRVRVKEPRNLCTLLGLQLCSEKSTSMVFLDLISRQFKFNATSVYDECWLSYIQKVAYLPTGLGDQRNIPISTDFGRYWNSLAKKDIHLSGERTRHDGEKIK
jgi:hypothetical protein